MAPLSEEILALLFTEKLLDIDSEPFDRPCGDVETAVAVWDKERAA